jgi:hypothetical protein
MMQTTTTNLQYPPVGGDGEDAPVLQLTGKVFGEVAFDTAIAAWWIGVAVAAVVTVAAVVLTPTGGSWSPRLWSPTRAHRCSRQPFAPRAHELRRISPRGTA